MRSCGSRSCPTSRSGSKRGRFRAISARNWGSSGYSACTYRATVAPAPAPSRTASRAWSWKRVIRAFAASHRCKARSRCIAIYRWGDEAQRETWLPRMARGELIGCFGLTEPDFGSNPAGMRTSREARRKRLGSQRHEDVDHQRIDRRPRDRLGAERPTAFAASSSRAAPRGSPPTTSIANFRCARRSPASWCCPTAACPPRPCCRTATA